jgi:predicted CoA-binding protein
MVSCTVAPDEVLKQSQVVAVVGASKNPEKEANSVPLYLIQHGYTVIPVNPTADTIHGLKAYPSLAELPPELAARVEVVEVFRPSEQLPEIARQVVEMRKKTKKTLVFWAQLGLENEEAKRILKENDVPYVMGVCMRTQHQLLSGAQ